MTLVEQSSKVLLPTSELSHFYMKTSHAKPPDRFNKNLPRLENKSLFDIQESLLVAPLSFFALIAKSTKKLRLPEQRQTRQLKPDAT